MTSTCIMLTRKRKSLAIIGERTVDCDENIAPRGIRNPMSITSFAVLQSYYCNIRRTRLLIEELDSVSRITAM